MVDTRLPLHILVVAPGSAPTRTLERALARLGRECRPPHEIRVLGRPDRLAELHRAFVASRAARRFADLCNAAGFSRDEILFNGRTLHPVDVPAGDASNETADEVLNLLRTFTAGSLSLTVVIAEDAGVAGHLLFGALHLAGRATDRVLVDVMRPASRARDNHDAQVEVPLLLWPANEPSPATYAEAVQRRRIERRRIVTPDVLSLDRRRRTVSVGETVLTLPAMQFFWLHYLALSAGERFPLAELSAHITSRGLRPFVQKLSSGRVRTFPADLQRAFVQMVPAGADTFEGMYQRACGLHPGLPSTISKVNAALRRALGRGAGPYLVEGGRGTGGYRITLSPSAIQIVGAEMKKW